MKKMFILGLDGAAYELIYSFSKEGILPNISYILEKGACFSLNSTMPPHTAPGWVSSLTGVNPGQHGIYQFWDTNGYDYEGKFLGSTDVRVPFVWEILNKYNIKTGMINIPMTHPPKPVNGYILTWPLSNTLNYSYPNTLIRELIKEKCHFASDITTMFQGDMDYINQAVEIVVKRIETIRFLLKTKPTDFFMSVFTEIDRVSHFYWKYLEEENTTLQNAIKRIYVECDKAVGEILDLIDDETLFLIYSDHGFRRCEFDYYIQTFLVKEKILALREMKPDEKKKNNWFEYTNKEGKNYQVDWDKTVAFMACPGSYGININLKGRQKNGIISPEDYKKTCETIVQLLRKIKHPLREEPLFRRVYTRYEVYHGEMVEKAPDIIMEPSDFEFMVHHKISDGELYSKQCEQSGIHSVNGILMLYGKSLEAYKVKQPTDLNDIAPTILEYYGIGKPYYMEGESVLVGKRIEKNNNYDIEMEKISNFNYSDQEEIEIKDHLAKLGYF